MAKKIDPRMIEILTLYNENPEDALWDCHGTWVAYHAAIERIAAKANIVFEMPQIVEASASSKTVSIVVRGTMGEKSEWSFGEASPSNNKNSYPYAMAEKRAKDRVTLKLIGLHGLVYSEEESDDFKPQQQVAEKPKRVVGFRDDGTRTPHSLRKDGVWKEFEREMMECTSVPMLTKLALAWSRKADDDKWPESWKALAREEINKRKDVLLNPPPLPDDDTFPGDLPTGQNSYADNYRAG